MYNVKVNFIEEWKYVYIKGEKTNYLVSNKGHVYNIKRGKFVKAIKTSDGYCKVNISHNGKSYNKKIHILVAKAFIVNNDDSLNMINHKNGIKTQNRFSNLEYCNNSQNQLHAYRHNLKRKPPEKNPSELVEMICEHLQNKKSISEIKELTKEYRKENNITTDIKSLIVHVKNRKSWTHISKKYIW